MVTFFVAVLFFCFCISNTLTRIFATVTSFVVAVLIGWCIQSTWESSDAMEAWFSGLLPFIARMLGNARTTCRRILALIDFRLLGESPSSTALDRAGRVRSRPDREGVGVEV
jgi:hypothetical protein